MNNRSFTEKDWKIFRKEIAGWQEAYMDKLNNEYIKILTGNGDPSDKFWTLDKRIKNDKKAAGVVIEMSRSKMEDNLLSLLSEGAITLDDLDVFSDDFRDRMIYLAEKWIGLKKEKEAGR